MCGVLHRDCGCGDCWEICWLLNCVRIAPEELGERADKGYFETYGGDF